MPDGRFRWRRFDDHSGEPWSRWHATTGPCDSCCCAPVHECSTCGRREHSEPGEPVSTFDTVHIVYCQGCGEDLLGERPRIEASDA